MANFSAAEVKRLRDLSGAGMMDCKNALTEADGNIDEAIEVLRKKGVKDAASAPTAPRPTAWSPPSSTATGPACWSS